MDIRLWLLNLSKGMCVENLRERTICTWCTRNMFSECCEEIIFCTIRKFTHISDTVNILFVWLQQSTHLSNSSCYLLCEKICAYSWIVKVLNSVKYFQILNLMLYNKCVTFYNFNCIITHRYIQLRYFSAMSGYYLWINSKLNSYF